VFSVAKKIMKSIINILEEKISKVMAAVTGEQSCAAIVKPSVDSRFGDYQANGVMAIAKKLKTNPRQLAEKVVAKLNISDICETPQVAGPGFINLRLRPEFLGKALLEIHRDKNLGIEKTANPQTIVVDYSGPNIAKEMQVGHLRSTVIGDSIARMLMCLGHNVIRQNHIGDWGTQFGRVILALWHICMAENLHKTEKPYYAEELEEFKKHAQDKQQLYALCEKIRNRHESDWLKDQIKEEGDGERYFCPFLKGLPNVLWPEILSAYQFVNILDESIIGTGLTIRTRQKGTILYEDLSRHVTGMLQNEKDRKRNGPEYEAWEIIKDITLQKCNEIYRRLDVLLTDNDVRGERFYNDKLPDVVKDLKDKKLAVESDGAVCVFPEGFISKEGTSLPFIIQKSQKSDGAFLYATTDLAALRYRVNVLKTDRIVYVTDARQTQHFQMLFKVAEMAGWNKQDGKKVELVHVTFGSVLGEDGKPLKTREGENVKLTDLLDEAVKRAKTVVEEKNPELDENQKEQIANAVGIGAVKYADYSNNRTSDYIFSFDKMLAMDGNTAPYMQYAYARIKSIERKALSEDIDIKTELAGVKKLNLTDPAEIDLAKHLCRYGEAVESAAADYKPNFLTSYLHELAQKFSVFYTNCPVLKAPADKKFTRLLLCDLTAKTIKHGLNVLLGIKVVEQM
jgi:arginyl-tRNA synthetase